MKGEMIFKLSIQYDIWLTKRKSGDKFSWGSTGRALDDPIKTVHKLFKDMDEEEKEAAFRREVYNTIHEHMLK